jgi:hypothetical protein
LSNLESNNFQIKSQAGSSAGFFIVLALIVNGLAIFYLLPFINIPFGVKLFAFAIGALISWSAIYSLWQRIRGGTVTLILPCDPLPLGVPITINLLTNKSIEAKYWLLEASVEDSSGEAYRLWSQNFAVIQTDKNHLVCEITLPNDQFKGRRIQARSARRLIEL